MPLLELVDETFVVAPPERLRAVLCDSARWQRRLPDLSLTPYEERGLEGVRWVVTGALVGTAEVWLERYADGTIVHVFFRCDPVGRQVGWHWTRRRRTASSADRLRRRLAIAVKQEMFGVKDAFEVGRLPGQASPLPPAGPAVVRPLR
jgi:hypothetical protein